MNKTILRTALVVAIPLALVGGGVALAETGVNPAPTTQMTAVDPLTGAAIPASGVTPAPTDSTAPATVPTPGPTDPTLVAPTFPTSDPMATNTPSLVPAPSTDEDGDDEGDDVDESDSVSGVPDAVSNLGSNH